MKSQKEKMFNLSLKSETVYRNAAKWYSKSPHKLIDLLREKCSPEELHKKIGERGIFSSNSVRKRSPKNVSIKEALDNIEKFKLWKNKSSTNYAILYRIYEKERANDKCTHAKILAKELGISRQNFNNKHFKLLRKDDRFIVKAQGFCTIHRADYLMLTSKVKDFLSVMEK